MTFRFFLFFCCHDILAIIMLVVLQERLSTCALVCSTWAAAAASSSKTLMVHLRSQVQADNLAAWLVQHGPSIEHMSICRYSQDNLRLRP